VTDSINYIVKIVIHMGPNFISPESVKNIVCVRQLICKIAPKKSQEVQFGPFDSSWIKESCLPGNWFRILTFRHVCNQSKFAVCLYLGSAEDVSG